MYYKNFIKILEEVLNKYLITDTSKLSGKEILKYKNNIIFFIDGTFGYFEDTGEIELMDIDVFIHTYSRTYNSEHNRTVWEPIQEFLKTYHSEYFALLESSYAEDNKSYKENLRKMSLMNAKNSLKDFQNRYPELNITYNETDNNN